MKIGVIGAGNMGQALVQGFIKSRIHKSQDIYIYDKDQVKARHFASEYELSYCENIKNIPALVDIILLAVKPQNLGELALELGGKLRRGTSIISILAGTSLDRLSELLTGEDLSYCRAMPNTPALVGEGVSALCFKGGSSDFEDYCLNLFGSCGIALKVDEAKMDAVTAISGSGPAYVMIFLKGLVEAGLDLGLTYDEAFTLATNTLRGTSSLAMKSEDGLQTLIDRVCSPGGTTIAAVDVFARESFEDIIKMAARAAAKRSEELAQNKE